MCLRFSVCDLLPLSRCPFQGDDNSESALREPPIGTQFFFPRTQPPLSGVGGRLCGADQPVKQCLFAKLCEEECHSDFLRPDPLLLGHPELWILYLPGLLQILLHASSDRNCESNLAFL